MTTLRIVKEGKKPHKDLFSNDCLELTVKLYVLSNCFWNCHKLPKYISEHRLIRCSVLRTTVALLCCIWVLL